MNLSHHVDYHNWRYDKKCSCGAEASRFDFVPDTIYGLSIVEACCRHDHRYEIGGVELDKQSADREFLANMLILIEERSNRKTDTTGMKWYLKLYSKTCDFTYPAFLARKRALNYYEAVVRAGYSSFNWRTN